MGPMSRLVKVVKACYNRGRIKITSQKGETMKDIQMYKYMNAGTGVYRKNINSKDLGASCLIWIGIIAGIGIMFLFV